MTLLVAWLDDPGDPQTLNLAADSQITQRTDAGNTIWLHATKIFRMFPRHDYLAYTGTSLYALTAIHQAAAVIGCTDILASTPNVQARVGAFGLNIGPVLESYPRAMRPDATLVWGGYNAQLRRVEVFELGLHGPNITAKPLDLSLGYQAFGSGAAAAHRILQHKAAVTAQEVIAAIEQVISDSRVPAVGGYPQMVTVNADGSRPQAFVRTINNVEEALLWGVPVNFARSPEGVDFRDEVFSVARNPRDGRIRRCGQELG